MLHRRFLQLPWFAHLAGEGGDDGLGMDQVGLAQVVEAVRAEDLRASLPPHRLLELHPNNAHMKPVSRHTINEQTRRFPNSRLSLPYNQNATQPARFKVLRKVIFDSAQLLSNTFLV